MNEIIFSLEELANSDAVTDTQATHILDVLVPTLRKWQRENHARRALSRSGWGGYIDRLSR